MPRLGKYSPHIAPVGTVVIDLGEKNQVVELWKSCSKASVQKAQNGPSTQLIESKSCIERSNATIKAEKHKLSNANNGQKSLKLPIVKEACQKVGAHERQ